MNTRLQLIAFVTILDMLMTINEANYLSRGNIVQDVKLHTAVRGKGL
jgi:hypothetical protein